MSKEQFIEYLKKQDYSYLIDLLEFYTWGSIAKAKGVYVWIEDLTTEEAPGNVEILKSEKQVIEKVISYLEDCDLFDLIIEDVFCEKEK